jgi:hypothetical protein
MNAMQGKFFLPSVIVLATLLIACAPKVANSAENQVVMSGSRSEAITTAHPENFPSVPPADCPVTVPQEPAFVPPPPYDQLGQEGEFWYGSNSLWTSVRRNGTWEGLPLSQDGYIQKVLWWRAGYDREAEPEPVLKVTAERIDAKAPPGESSTATNASAGDIGTAMLVGLNLPAPGCWKITGKYGEVELSFVVWILP